MLELEPESELALEPEQELWSVQVCKQGLEFGREVESELELELEPELEFGREVESELELELGLALEPEPEPEPESELVLEWVLEPEWVSASASGLASVLVRGMDLRCEEHTQIHLYPRSDK